jgi:hypothetical protein
MQTAFLTAMTTTQVRMTGQQWPRVPLSMTLASQQLVANIASVGVLVLILVPGLLTLFSTLANCSLLGQRQWSSNALASMVKPVKSTAFQALTPHGKTVSCCYTPVAAALPFVVCHRMAFCCQAAMKALSAMTSPCILAASGSQQKAGSTGCVGAHMA